MVREGQNPTMATEEVLDERDADALFTLLERRLPAGPDQHADADDAPR